MKKNLVTLGFNRAGMLGCAWLATALWLAPSVQASGPLGADGGWATDQNGGVYWTPSQCQTWSAGGIGMMRMGARLPGNTAASMWTNGSPNLAAYDTVVNNLRAQGIQVVMLINGESYYNSHNYDPNANANETNSVANGDNAYIDDFVAKAVQPLVAHFHDRVKVYEIWNEEAATSTYVYPSCYSWMMTKSWRAVHVTLGYSDCLVVTSDGTDGTPTDGPYLNSLFQAGNNPAVNSFLSNRSLYGCYPMDGYGQHLYIDGWELAPSADIQTCIDTYRNTYMGYEGSSNSWKGTWITEIGWDANYLQQRNPTWSWAQCLSVQAQNLTTSFNVFNTQGAGSYVKFTSWFSWQDGAGMYFGLHDTSGNPLPDYTSFTNFSFYEGRTSIGGGIDTNVLNYFNNNGGQPVLGSPYDNGGGAYVHAWSGGNAQDYTGGSHLRLGLMESTAMGVFQVNDVHGLWGYYLTNNGVTAFGYPGDEEYTSGSGTRQDFANGYLTWSPTGGIAWTALPRPSAAPSGLTATAVSGSQINLAWVNNATNQTAVWVERSLDNVSFIQVASLAGTATTYSDSGLLGSTTFYYRVRGANSGNPGPASNVATATTQPGVPWPPTGLACIPRSNYVQMSWRAPATGTPPTSYNVKRSPTSGGPYSPVGTATASNYTDNTAANGSTYYYVVSAVNSYGESANSSEASAAPSATALPVPWLDRDIGSNVQIPGSASYSGGTFTVKGSGDDIWNQSDNFHYCYQPASGDVTLIARVATQQNTDPWAKAGVMIRESLAANSTHAMVILSPGNGANFQWRAATGGSSAYQQQTGVAAPYWVKLVRSGNTFSGYRSPDGVTWTQIGTNVSFTMAGSYYVGLPVTAHVYPTQVLNTSTFDNVSVANTLPAAPTGLKATPSQNNNSIDLAWTQSVSPNITTNKVYRALVSGGPYTLVKSIAATTSYNDNAVTSGKTYYYVVTAVDGIGVESPYSNQASATSSSN
jgi:hypothetical protein